MKNLAESLISKFNSNRIINKVLGKTTILCNHEPVLSGIVLWVDPKSRIYVYKCSKCNRYISSNELFDI